MWLRAPTVLNLVPVLFGKSHRQESVELKLGSRWLFVVNEMTLLPSLNTCLSQDVPSDQSETRADQFSAPSLLLDYLESVLFSSDDIV